MVNVTVVAEQGSLALLDAVTKVCAYSNFKLAESDPSESSSEEDCLCAGGGIGCDWDF